MVSAIRVPIPVVVVVVVGNNASIFQPTSEEREEASEEMYMWALTID
jgi:hypothetical protein